MQPKRVVRSPAQRQRHVGAVAKSLAQPAQMQRAGIVRLVRKQHGDQSVAISDKVAQ